MRRDFIFVIKLSGLGITCAVRFRVCNYFTGTRHVRILTADITVIFCFHSTATTAHCYELTFQAFRRNVSSTAPVLHFFPDILEAFSEKISKKERLSRSCSLLNVILPKLFELSAGDAFVAEKEEMPMFFRKAAVSYKK